MSREFLIPESLARTNTQARGKEGKAWLERLPGIVAQCQARWSLTVDAPFPKLSYNYAAPATLPDGTRAVLKVCVPDHEFKTEEEALRLYAGRGSVRLLEADVGLGAMLLERLEPGTMLYEVKDDERATSIAASVMKELWRPAPAGHPFPTVARWAKGMERLRKEFGGTSGPFPEPLVARAEGLFADLLSSMAAPVVLHGDLHHYNILAAQREPWLAIDPKGVVGEPAYEPGALIRNPMPDIVSLPDLPRVQARRLDQLSEELGFDRDRLYAWSVAQAVLSAWWTYEDGGKDWNVQIEIVRALVEIGG